MGEAAYEQAKAEGSLMQQRLRNLVEQGLLVEPEELFVLAEAADSIEWLSKERDSLIAENERIRRQRDDNRAEINRLTGELGRQKNIVKANTDRLLKRYYRLRNGLESLLELPE